MYKALYRKYRPNTFLDVIGQEHIVKTLKTEIKTNRISHAYLFCGTRGTGKTSIAKIFAKAINCENPINGEPCEKCLSCNNIAENRSINVIEIDAASNNSIDNIREIKEEVKYTPTEGKYKVYIIDEIHMLSQSAFNALLKTLEEPPKHIIFILATTDPQKIPITVLSRCQRFDFKRISSNNIVNALLKYTKIENIEIEEKALKYISYLADGSMRDSLSILDQCISLFYKEKITLEKVIDILGIVDNSIFFKTTDAILNKNIKEILDIIDEIIIKGKNLKNFILDLITHFRNLLVISKVNEAHNILDISEENIKKLQEQSKNISIEELIYLIKTFSTFLNDIKYLDNERILIEVLFIKICSNVTEMNFESILSRISIIEKEIKNKYKTNIQNNYSQNINLIENKEKNIKTNKNENIENIKINKNENINLSKLKNLWFEICENFTNPLKTILLETELKLKDTNILYICFKEDFKLLIVKNNIQKIKDKIMEITEINFEISIITENEYNKLYENEYKTDKNNNQNLWIEKIKDKIPDIDFIE